VEVVSLAHRQAPLAYRQSLREIALMEGQLPHPKGGDHEAEGMRRRFGQTEDVGTHRLPFGKGANLRETHE
jgi:hypothetical protein